MTSQFTEADLRNFPDFGKDNEKVLKGKFFNTPDNSDSSNPSTTGVGQ